MVDCQRRTIKGYDRCNKGGRSEIIPCSFLPILDKPFSGFPRQYWFFFIQAKNHAEGKKLPVWPTRWTLLFNSYITRTLLDVRLACTHQKFNVSLAYNYNEDNIWNSPCFLSTCSQCHWAFEEIINLVTAWKNYIIFTRDSMYYISVLGNESIIPLIGKWS